MLSKYENKLAVTLEIPDDLEYDILNLKGWLFQQQIDQGWSNMYFRTIGEYFEHGAIHTYSTSGTLEFDANQYSLKKIGYYYNVYQ